MDYTINIVGSLNKTNAILGSEDGVITVDKSETTSPAVDTSAVVVFPSGLYNKSYWASMVNPLNFPKDPSDQLHFELLFFVDRGTINQFNQYLELQYRGRIDSGTMDLKNSEIKRELYEAMQLIIKTGKGPIKQFNSFGCSIKWKN